MSQHQVAPVFTQHRTEHSIADRDFTSTFQYKSTRTHKQTCLKRTCMTLMTKLTGCGGRREQKHSPFNEGFVRLNIDNSSMYVWLALKNSCPGNLLLFMPVKQWQWHINNNNVPRYFVQRPCCKATHTTTNETLALFVSLRPWITAACTNKYEPEVSKTSRLLQQRQGWQKENQNPKKFLRRQKEPSR